MFVCKKVKKEKEEGGVVATHAAMRNHFSFLQADNNAKPMQVVLVHREKQLFHGKNINVDGVMIHFIARVASFESQHLEKLGFEEMIVFASSDP